MPTLEIISSTFPLFSQLPGELRNQIWRYAVPDIGLVLYPYRKNCFRRGLLRPAIVVPLVFVCREARGVAMMWMREEGIEIKFRKRTQSHTFVRTFDPMRDVMYIPPNKFNTFCPEPQNEQEDLGLEREKTLRQADIKYVAIVESLLRSDAFDELSPRFPRLQVLFVIVDVEVDDGDDNIGNKGRWEVQNSRGKDLVYKPSKGKFILGAGDYICEECVYQRVERSSQWLSERIQNGQLYPSGITIRLVVASKK